MIFTSIFILSKLKLSGNSVKEISTYTKAICNETNFCQDYIIECEGEEVKSLSPITGAIVQKPEEWEDKRENSPLCDY